MHKRAYGSCGLLESGHTISSRENIPLWAESIPGLTSPQRLWMQARSIACRRGGRRSYKLHLQVGQKKKYILSSINRWCLRGQVHNLIMVGEPVVDQSRQHYPRQQQTWAALVYPVQLHREVHLEMCFCVERSGDPVWHDGTRTPLKTYGGPQCGIPPTISHWPLPCKFYNITFMKLGSSIHVQDSPEQKVQTVDGFHRSTQLYYTNRHMGSCVVAHIQS